MNTAVLEIDLANYARIAKRMYPAGQGLAICNSAGQLMLSSDESIEQRIAGLALAAPGWSESVADIKPIALGDNCSVLIMNLQGSAGSSGVLLLWWLDKAPSPGRLEDPNDTLLSLGICVRNELELQTELDAMAIELSKRYEELNLVYHTDDQVSYFREGYQAFQALAQNCSDYLNSGLAMLCLRDKGVTIESRSNLDAKDLRLVSSLLDNQLYDQVVTSSEFVFVNNDENDSSPVKGSVPYRLMVGPITGFDGRTEGVLLIANLLSALPFSNSDKNLLEVMGRKAAKIIQGSYDGLTGMLNRASFEHLVDEEIERIKSNGGIHCLLHINVDKLHRINDTLGYEAGDMIIRRFAAAVEAELRDTDSIARIGGDEIGVLIRSCQAKKGKTIAEKLLGVLASQHFEWDGQSIEVSASIGVALLSKEVVSGEEAMKHAVVACEEVKEQGGKSVQVYEQGDERLKEREANMWMVGTVAEALRENRFLLYAQPILPLKASGRPHLEILLRMVDGDKIVSPNAFLPASERYQMMLSIDKWVVERSLLEIGLYLDTQPATPPIFGINLSGQSFCAPEFLEFVLETLDKSTVPAELICFEITETAAVSNMVQAQTFISALRAKACQFALDDFGAGLSSFGYLKSFDVQYLKIDGALVRDIEKDKVNAAMVASVNQIGHVMGLQTIAEFVETAQSRALLAKMGVDYIQGYLIGKPIPLSEQLAVLDSRPALSLQ